MPFARRIQPQHSSAVCSCEPFVSHVSQCRDPVVLQMRIGGGVVGAHGIVIQHGQSAQRPRHGLGAACGDRVHVIVHQPMKDVETAYAGAIDERKARGRGHHHASIAESDVGDVIGKEAVLAAHHLARLRARIEQHQAIRRCHRGARVFRIRDDAIDAEQGVVFMMDGVFQTGIHYVESAIEIADPQPAAAQRQRRHVAVGHDESSGGEHGPPALRRGIVTVNRAFANRVHLALDIHQTARGNRWCFGIRTQRAARVATATGLQ